jgi:hypothetical protein
MKRACIAMAVAVALTLVGACGGGGTKSASSTTTGREVGPALPADTSQTLPGGTDDGDPTIRPLPWDAPSSNIAGLISAAGLPAFGQEKLSFHIHAHVDVFYNGDAQTVPAQLGIDLQNGVISPLHTHDTTGIIHVENETKAQFMLGQLFTEWQVRFTATCAGGYCAPATPIAVYVDGTKFTGDPTTIEFTAHREIAVVIGTPPKSIPSSYAFPNGL